MELATALDQYARIVGADRAITGGEALDAYGGDVTENSAVRPSLVLKPTAVEQVQEILRIATAERTAVTPAVARMNVGGLTIPAEGGIVVDLSEMNRVVELDRDHMHVVVEPGVSFQQLKDLLAREAPELTVSYPLAPPYVSVLANFLLDGLGSLSLLHGSAGEQIGGLEAVLADGTLARTGACAVSPTWFGRGPLPDLTGLFVNWQGSSGIVTKLAVQLWRQPALRRRLFVMSGDLERSFELIRELTHSGLCRDLSAFSWPVAKMALGVERPLERDPAEPEAVVYFDLGADDEEGLRYMEKATRRIVDEHRRDGLPIAGVATIEELVAVAPSLGRFADFPMTLDFLLDYPGGGLTWVGTYGPTKAWEAGAKRCCELMTDRGFPPMLVIRPMKGGHYGVLRAIACFDRSDPEAVEDVHRLNVDLFSALLDLGFLAYKAPDWAVREMARRADPGFLELFSRVREALDPQGVLNPSRLPFDS